MKLLSFIGGTDEQRSTNLSDDKCINLYPVTNNNGTVQGFYKVDGLKLEGTLSGIPTGAYKASNGRAFYVAGTVLYELTVVGGVYTSTSRGTVTAGTYEFSDNGLELIGVNGTDGRILTFSSNALAKIAVVSTDVTLSIATPCVATKAAHGLVVGNAFMFTSTGTLPNGVTANTRYYVVSSGFTTGTFQFSLTLGGTSVNTTETLGDHSFYIVGDVGIAISSETTFTKINHGLAAGDSITFTTTEVLPTGLNNYTTYYVLASGLTANIFYVSTTQGGAKLVTSGIQSGVHSFIAKKGTLENIDVTISTASPAVVTIPTTTSTVTPLTPDYVTGGAGNSGVALSTDGLFAYGTNTGSNQIYCYSISSGLLVYASAVNTSASPYKIIVSANNKFVYATCSADDVVVAFTRNLSTGALTPISTYDTGNNPVGLSESPDGFHLYVANQNDNAAAGSLSSYSINQTTGVLTPVATTLTGANGCFDVAVSPDNSHVYATNNQGQSIAAFARNTGTGVITAVSGSPFSCASNAKGVAISPDNLFVYAVCGTGNTVSVFSRNLSTGILTPISSSVTTASNPTDIKISSTGLDVYISCSTGNVVSAFSRSTSTGLITLVTDVVTGVTPAFMSLNTSYLYVASTDAKIFQYAVGGTQHKTTAGSSIVFETTGLLPLGIEAGVTYYVLSTGITTNTFRISDTLEGTAINTTNPVGIITVTTLGYGFPNGCTTVSYMNGRFIACEPNTQNFYVSEVLDGVYWDAINVQTVDSNPDYVITQAVSHNELIVFCDESGEVFYDSGTIPTPFVRNTSGIFEIGCAAKYSVANLDNTIYWLGKSSQGNGIVYKLSGYTPQRISTFSIENEIQAMTDISDAKAYSYQKDGHHYYAITFPSSIKTFVYDVNTQLWHERVDSAVGVDPNYLYLTALTPATIATGVSPYGVYVTPDDLNVYVCNSTSGTVSQYSRSLTTGLLTAIGSPVSTTGASPIIITGSADGLSLYVSNDTGGISHFSRDAGTGLITFVSAVTSGQNSRGVCVSPDDKNVYAANRGGIQGITEYTRSLSTGVITILGNIALTGNPDGIAISPDGLFVYVTTTTTNTIVIYSRNATTGVLTLSTSIACGNSSYGIIATTTNVYASSFSENFIYQYSRNTTTGALTLLGTIATGTSPFGIAVSSDKSTLLVANSGNATISNFHIPATGILELSGYAAIASGTTPISISITSDDKFVYSANSGVNTVSKYSFTSANTQRIIGYYIYFNNKHLAMHTGFEALYSYDSSTYKNGTKSMPYTRSFRAPESDMKYVRHNLLEIEAETGVGATIADVISLRWSNDNGNTWSTPITRPLGTSGEFAKLIRWHRLGQTKGYPRIYEISGNSNTKIAILAVYLS